MPVEFSNLADVFNFHREVAGRLEAQMKALRDARPQDLPGLLTAASSDALQRAQAALVQAVEEHAQGLRYLDARVARRRDELERLEAQLKRTNEQAGVLAAQMEAGPASQGPEAGPTIQPPTGGQSMDGEGQNDR